MREARYRPTTEYVLKQEEAATAQSEKQIAAFDAKLRDRINADINVLAEKYGVTRDVVLANMRELLKAGSKNV